MKEVDPSKCELVTYECNCGFHFGVDASYLDKVDEDFVMDCPICKNKNFAPILIDADPDFNDQIKIIVSVSPTEFHIKPQGYGTAHDNVPIMLELLNGKLRLIIWADKKQEDPTHTINLEKARDTPRTNTEIFMKEK